MPWRAILRILAVPVAYELAAQIVRGIRTLSRRWLGRSEVETPPPVEHNPEVDKYVHNRPIDDG